MTSIENLVRRIDQQTYRADHTNHFIYDDSTKQFARKPPLFRAGRLWYFELECSPFGTPSATGAVGPIGVTDPDTGHLVRFRIHYEAWILPQNAEDFLRSVASEDPGARAVELVVAAVRKRLLADPRRLADGEGLNARDIERELLKHGLCVSLRVEFETPASAGTSLPLQKIVVSVQLSDYFDELKLQLIIATSVRAGEQRRAYDALQRMAPLSEAIDGATREFFIDKALRQLRSGALNEGLRARLRNELAKRFIELQSLQVAIQTALPEVEQTFEGQATFDVALQAYPRPVRLNTRVLLQLVDESLYFRARTPELGGWIRENVVKAAQQVLFEASYSELCLNMARWKDEIREALQAAAQTIGYSVKAHVTKPEAVELAFLSPFTLEVDGQFGTAIEVVSTNVKVVLRLQLDSLQSVAREMNRGIDLNQAFREVVHEEIRAYLHTLQPAFLFTRFSAARDYMGRPTPVEGGADPKAVEQVLQDLITTSLRARFGLRLLSFTAKLGASSVLDRYYELTKQLVHFQVPVRTRGELGSVAHHGTLSVDGVAEGGWTRFQNQLPDLDKVAEAAQRAVRSMVATHTRSVADALEAHELSVLVYKDLPHRLREVFGVQVTVTDWYSDPGELAEIVQETDTTFVRSHQRKLIAEEQARVDRIADLKRRLFRLEDEDDSENAKKTEERIAVLERQHKSPFVFSRHVLGDPSVGPDRALAGEAAARESASDEDAG